MSCERSTPRMDPVVRRSAISAVILPSPQPTSSTRSSPRSVNWARLRSANHFCSDETSSYSRPCHSDSTLIAASWRHVGGWVTLPAACARRRGVARESRNDALLVVANLTDALRHLLLAVVGEVRKVAAHEPLWGGAMLGTALLIEFGDLLEPAIAHRGGERSDDKSAPEPGGKLDRRLGEGSHIGRQGPLHGLRRDRYVIEGVVPATVRDRRVGGPQPADHLHAFLEHRLIVLERYVEGQILAAVVSAPGGEINASTTEQVQRRPLLGDANGVMEREHGHGRRESYVSGAGRDIGQHDVRTGQHPERAEMMFADPYGVHAELLRVERLRRDIRDELIRRARVAQVVIVAQREVAEVHVSILPAAKRRSATRHYVERM